MWYSIQMSPRYSLFRKKSLRTISIVAGSMAIAFVLGIETAGDVRPVVSTTRAGSEVLLGDLEGNGSLSLGDVRIALELAEGKRTPTPAELSADPNHDFRFTVDDALLIIDELERRR
jgi:hypothetical protein